MNEQTVNFGDTKSPLPNIPTPREPEHVSPEKFMDFNDALNMAKIGCRITRKAWEPGWSCAMGDEVLEIYHPDGKKYGWWINKGDMEAVDWFVLEDKR